jgi:hypothetical protein
MIILEEIVRQDEVVQIMILKIITHKIIRLDNILQEQKAAHQEEKAVLDMSLRHLQEATNRLLDLQVVVTLTVVPHQVVVVVEVDAEGNI